jgi:2,5-diketo-D-gluconate reductase A
MQIKHTSIANNTQIPLVGFGTYLIPNDDAEKVVGDALDAGYRHIDTAEGYGNEEGIGRAINTRIARGDFNRDELFITTKLWPGAPIYGQTVKTYEETLASLNKSLEKLGVEYVDLYLIHVPVDQRSRLQHWKALVELQRLGKAKSIGVSNFTQAHIEELVAAGYPLPAANQIELHPWSQKHELVDYMQSKGILPIAYSSLVPLSSWRTGEGQDSAKTADMQQEGEDLNSPFKRIAAKYGVTESQLLLRWAIENGYPVLPKTTRPERMRQNLDLFHFSIDGADLAEMRALNRDASVAWPVGDPSELMA